LHLFQALVAVKLTFVRVKYAICAAYEVSFSNRKVNEALVLISILK